MTSLIKIIAVAILLSVSGLSAQNFQGQATYKTKRKVDVKLDSTQMSGEMQQRMMEMLKKQFEKTFVLSFNKEASIYKEEESLSAPQPAGMQVVMFDSGGADVLYKNTKENRFTNQNDVFGKVFLIKDNLEALEWKMSGEKKNIGNYECFKATITGEREVRDGGVSFNGDKDLDESENVRMEPYTITAWYSPEIPVNNGPGRYFGLPGLILEVNDGQETVICSKIVINPKEKLSIVEPKKGKEVTQAEFDEILQKKMEEMNERYRPSGDNDGERIEIRIGG
ncbi:MAG: GLPGLI family protein [Bacteroidetes bacterium MedPE-SWsnd-G2]|nr:MAG: GLPGLI family protein [Bacteroidetes bacterium MedPE-SWsnd-G2]